jgi:hypothetical protein
MESMGKEWKRNKYPCNNRSKCYMNNSQRDSCERARKKRKNFIPIKPISWSTSAKRNCIIKILLNITKKKINFFFARYQSEFGEEERNGKNSIILQLWEHTRVRERKIEKMRAKTTLAAFGLVECEENRRIFFVRTREREIGAWA